MAVLDFAFPNLVIPSELSLAPELAFPNLVVQVPQLAPDLAFPNLVIPSEPSLAPDLAFLIRKHDARL